MPTSERTAPYEVSRATLGVLLILFTAAVAGCGGTGSEDAASGPDGAAAAPPSAVATHEGQAEAELVQVVETEDLPAGVVWRYPGPDSEMVLDPVLADGTLYFGLDGTVWAVDPASGRAEWAFETPGAIEGDRTPLLAEGLLFVRSRGVSGGSHLFALDLETGRPAWDLPSFNSVFEPALVDGELYVPFDTKVESGTGYMSGPEQILVLDPGTGEEMRRLDAQSPMAVAEDVVAAVRPAEPGPFGEVLVVLDPETGVVRWERDLSEGRVAALTMAHGALYYGLHEELIKADPGTGRPLWSYDTADPHHPAELVSGPTAIFFATEWKGERIHAVDAESGQAVWTAPLRDAWDLSGTPVIIDGTLRVAITSPSSGDDPEPATELLMLDLDSGRSEVVHRLRRRVQGKPLLWQDRALFHDDAGGFYAVELP